MAAVVRSHQPTTSETAEGRRRLMVATESQASARAQQQAGPPGLGPRADRSTAHPSAAAGGTAVHWAAE